jgi:hypothetical protein
MLFFPVLLILRGKFTACNKLSFGSIITRNSFSFDSKLVKLNIPINIKSSFRVKVNTYLNNIWKNGKSIISKPDLRKSLILDEQDKGRTILYKGDIDDVQITKQLDKHVSNVNLVYKTVKLLNLGSDSELLNDSANLSTQGYWIISIPQSVSAYIIVNAKTLLENNFKVNTRGLSTDGFLKDMKTGKTFLRYKIEDPIVESVNFID